MLKTANKYWGFTILFCSLHVYALLPQPVVWQENVIQSDYIAVVECVAAGTIVAEYKVLETLKGETYKSPIRIKKSPILDHNYREPYLWSALIGEQYLIFTCKMEYQPNPPSAYLWHPLLWRNIDYQYELHALGVQHYIGETKRTEYRTTDLGRLVRHQIDLADYTAMIRNLVNQDTRQQELTLLKALFSKHATNRYAQEYDYNERFLKRAKDLLPYVDETTAELFKQEELKKEKYIEVVSQIEQEIQSCRNSFEFVDKAFELSDRYSEGEHHLIAKIFVEGILTEESLEYLETHNVNENPDEFIRYTCNLISQRLTEKPQFSGRSKNQSIIKTPAELETDYPQLLTDSIAAAKWLADWENPNKKQTDETLGYGLGSWVAKTCRQDTDKCLEILRQAKDPYVRVAGAVYLCFENEEEGMNQLRNMQQLEGGARFWAALNLARRGDKQVMDYILWNFHGYRYNNSNPHDMQHNLIKRSMVLLSNSAANSNIPQPPNVLQGASYSDLVTWWDNYKDRIELYDPWLDILEIQKVD